MNYDFTPLETALFADVATALKNLPADADPDSRQAVLDKDLLCRITGCLAQTSYLRLGLEPVADLNGHLTLMGAMEALACRSPSAYLAVEASTRLFGRAVAGWGDTARKARWLKPVLAGDLIGALALSETFTHSANQSLSTCGEKHGQQVTVTGAKQYVINAPVADWIAVAGMLEERFALFFIQSTTPGLFIDTPLETMGYEGTAISHIRLDGCRIDADQVICPNNGQNVPEMLKMWENQILLGAALGISGAAFETARDFAKTHKSDGKPVIAHQEMGFKLAEMFTLLQTAQLLAYRTAWTMETNPVEARELMWCAKVFCIESAEQICSQALQVMGSAGCVEGNRAQTAYRCAKYNQVTGTSTEIARVKIGDAELGYRE